MMGAVKHRCPLCKAPIEAFTAVEKGTQPEPGTAITICFECLGFAILAESGQLERLNAEAFEALPPDTRTQLLFLRKAYEARRGLAKGELPPAYYRDVETMLEAARRWTLEHPCAQVTFAELDPRVMVIGNLDEYGIGVLTCNEPARDLLRYMDRAVSGRGTMFMARVAIDLLYAPKGQAQS